MFFYGGEFSISLFFPEIESRKKEEKEKPRKTITTALPPKESPDYFDLVVKRF